MKLFFWISLILLIYVYIGYPLLLICLAFFKSKPVKKADAEPEVSIIIPAYNEEEVVEEKIKNVLSLDYPRDKLEIIAASDGSTDLTVNILKKYLDSGVKVYDFSTRRGKPAVLNEVTPKSRGEIVVFSDASSILEKNAVRKLVRNFSDPSVGCVCADYKFAYSDVSLRGKGESLFVKYELFLKKKEAQLGSVLGLHGALYAIRKNLYSRLEVNTINDDYVLPARIVGKGFRSVFEEEAIAYERQNLTIEKEFKRRIRMSAGNWQQLTYLRFLFNPCLGLVLIEFVSHKVLRTMTPMLLFTLFISNRFIYGSGYTVVFFLQLLFYFTGAAGYILESFKIRLKFFYIPFYFCVSNAAVAIGFLKFLFGNQEVKWER